MSSYIFPIVKASLAALELSLLWVRSFETTVDVRLNKALVRLWVKTRVKGGDEEEDISCSVLCNLG